MPSILSSFNSPMNFSRAELKSVNPFDPSVHKGMAQALIQLNEREDAVRELSISAVLSPNDMQIQKLLLDLTR